MTDLSKLAATSCAELANRLRGVDYFNINTFMNCDWARLAFRQSVEQAHTLATEAIAHPERAAEILAPLILREPVEPDLLIAREACAQHCEDIGNQDFARKYRQGFFDDKEDDELQSAQAAIRLYRQREGGGNG